MRDSTDDEAGPAPTSPKRQPNAPIADITAALKNPLTVAGEAIQDALRSAQRQYTNTAPRITGRTDSPTAADEPAAAPAATANPLQQAFDNLRKNVQRTLFNSAPEVTLTEPSRNSDGSYTGRIVATDADGDPLTISGNFAAGGTTTVDAEGYYTYRPSESASSTPGLVHTIVVNVVEDNAESHVHGPAQIQNAIVATVLHALFGAVGYPQYSARSWGTTSTHVQIPVGPPVD